MLIEGEAATEDPPQPRRVPVTLLTGFLGAGKTARLNATLSSAALDSMAQASCRGRVAVIENELGAVGVDGALVANRHDDGVIELTNGCLCCSAEIDLVAAFEALARRRNSQPFDRLIVETTGLADVGPVVALLSDPEDPLCEEFVFDGVVTIIDAAGFRSWASAENTVIGDGSSGPVMAWASGFVSAAVASGTDLGGSPRVGRTAALAIYWRQVAHADQVIVSKTDLVVEDVVEEVLAAIAAVNPLAQVIVDHAVPCSPLPPPLGNALGGPRPRNLMSLPPRQSSPPSLCGASEPKRRRGDAAHLIGVDTFLLHPSPDRLLCASLLRRLCLGLLAGERMDGEDLGEAWRVKGLVALECQGPTLVQGVGDQLALEPWPHALEQAPFLVLIGERFRREAIEGALAVCCTPTTQLCLEAVE